MVKNIEKRKQYTKKYYQEHKEEKIKYSKYYREEHKSELKEKRKLYLKNHKKETDRYHKEWVKRNRERYNNICRKANHRRNRELGFVELNEWFKGSHAHHLNKEFILYIPVDLHRSISHNLWTGEGMEKINDLAIVYAYGISSEDREKEEAEI